MHGLWRTEPRGILSAEVDGVRLIVQAPEKAGGPVRFIVLCRETVGQSEIIVGSGTEDSVLDAMAAAERMAQRFGGC